MCSPKVCHVPSTTSVLLRLACMAEQQSLCVLEFALMSLCVSNVPECVGQLLSFF